MGMEDHMAMTTGNLYQKVPLEDTNLTDRKVLHDSDTAGECRTSDGRVYVKCGDFYETISKDDYNLRNIMPPYDKLPVRSSF